MDEQQFGVMPDSPAGTPEPSAPDTSAATENTGQTGPGPIPYSRFQEMVYARQHAEQRASQLEGRLQQLEGLIQRQQQRPDQPLSPEEQQAVQAMKRLFQADPELRQLWASRQAMPHLLNAATQTQQLQQIHQQTYLRTGRGELERAATDASLPVTPEALSYYEDLVAGVIRNTPGAQQRFQAGDLSVLSEAWGKVQSFLGGFRSQGAAQVARVKQQTRQLPPSLANTTGGVPSGQPAQPKFDPNARDAEQRLHEAAFARLRELNGTP